MKDSVVKSLPRALEPHYPGGLGFAGAYEKGRVFEQGTAAGAVGDWQSSIGFPGNAMNFGMFLFFRDEAALNG